MGSPRVSRSRSFCGHAFGKLMHRSRKSLFRRDAETNPRDACATQPYELPTPPRSLSWLMRMDKFTQKMQEALQAAQDLASQSNHQEITNEHFLSALLDHADGIARPLLEKIGVNANQL